MATQDLALRRTLFRAGQALDDRQALLGAAKAMHEAGSAAAARPLEEVARLRCGVHPHAAEPAPVRLEAAIDDLRTLLALEPLLLPLGGVVGEAAMDGWLAPTPHRPARDRDISTLPGALQALLDALAEPHAAAVEPALRRLREDVLDLGDFDLGDARTDCAILAGRLGFNAARSWLAEVYPLAFPPLGSGRLLHAAARLGEGGLGPFLSGAGLVLRRGDDALGLLQLASGQPLDIRAGGAGLARWIGLLGRAAPDGMVAELVDRLADQGAVEAVAALGTPLVERPASKVSRATLQRVRDAGMDLDALRLATRAQARMAELWPQDPNERLALGDLHAYQGDLRGAKAAFARALQLDPGNEHGRNCVRALDEGDVARFVNRGGFGTPQDRRRTRAAAARGEDDARNGDRDAPARALSLMMDGADLAAELAPSGVPAHERLHDGLHLRRLGARRERSPWGKVATLRGLEAVRGFYVSTTPILEVEVRLGGRLLAGTVPAAHPFGPVGERRRKHVFNIWLDLSAITPGFYELTLRANDLDGGSQEHRETVQIALPFSEADLPGSDTVVDPPPERLSGAELDAWVDARPTAVRAARRALLDPAPERVLVLRTDQLGDLVSSIPALRRLRALLPQAHITGLVSTSNAALARTLDLFDEVMVLDFRVDPVEKRRLLPLDRQRELKAELHARRFDLALDLADDSPSRLLMLLSGARTLVGMEGAGYGFLDFDVQSRTRDRANGSEVLPASAKTLLLIAWLEGALQSRTETLRRPDLTPARLERWRLEAGRYVVLHSGARLAFSRWPHFAELARELLDRTALDVVLIADEPPAPGALPPALLAHPRLRFLEEAPSFDDLDALLSFCTLFVGNDSGPKHLAALRGAEVVSLHCARNNWNEWGQENRGVILSRRLPCAGCQISQHPEECGRDIACLSLITPKDVLDAAKGPLGLG